MAGSQSLKSKFSCCKWLLHPHISVETLPLSQLLNVRPNCVCVLTSQAKVACSSWFPFPICRNSHCSICYQYTYFASYSFPLSANEQVLLLVHGSYPKDYTNRDPSWIFSTVPLYVSLTWLLLLLIFFMLQVVICFPSPHCPTSFCCEESSVELRL